MQEGQTTKLAMNSSCQSHYNNHRLDFWGSDWQEYSTATADTVVFIGETVTENTRPQRERVRSAAAGRPVISSELTNAQKNIEEEEDREDAAEGDTAKRDGGKIDETKDAETENEDSDEEIWGEDSSQSPTPIPTMEATSATSLEEAVLLKTAWRATNQVARRCIVKAIHELANPSLVPYQRIDILYQLLNFVPDLEKEEVCW